MNVGCFGKLPIYADFIRYNAGAGEVRILDQWFQEGIHWSKLKLSPKWQEGYASMQPYCFFLTEPGSKSGLLGVFVPGMDASGRLFPFSIFTMLQSDDIPSNLMFLPVRYRRFLGQAQKLALEGWKEMDVKALTEEVERLGNLSFPEQTETESEYLKFRDSLPSEKFWNSTHDRHGKPPDRHALIQGLADVLVPLRNSKSGLNYGIALPLPYEPELKEVGTSLWLDAVFNLLCSSSNSSSNSAGKKSYSFFWSLEENSNHGILFIFFSAPLPKSFSAFMYPDLDEDTIYDLGKLKQNMIDKLHGKIQGTMKEIIENPGSSMTDVINGLKKSWA